jgi:hypothetical protein
MDRIRQEYEKFIKNIQVYFEENPDGDECFHKIAERLVSDIREIETIRQEVHACEDPTKKSELRKKGAAKVKEATSYVGAQKEMLESIVKGLN